MHLRNCRWTHCKEAYRAPG